MRVRGALVAVVLVAGMGTLGAATAGAAPGGDPGPAPQAAPQATLVRTDIFWPAPDREPGRPAPATANCSNDDPNAYLSTPVFTGTISSPSSDHVALFNAATTPSSMTPDAARQALQSSFDTWTANSGAPTFSVQPATSGVVTKATANRHTDLLFGRTPGNALAVTYTWRWSDTGWYESDTVLSSSVPWTNIAGNTDGCAENVVAYDVQNIATHEFGHIYGLDHPKDDRYATMYAYGYTGETLKRTQATSDLNGIHSLYP
jgi:Matrixin